MTGQPAFDRFAKEDTEQIAQAVKEKLALKPADQLVVFISQLDGLEKISQLAEALKKAAGDFHLAFRPHPRDNVSYEDYKKILNAAGLKIVDTAEFSTDEIGAAADVVLTSYSTEGLNGIYRRKPTGYISDRNFNIPEYVNLPLPPVQLGAGAGIDHVEALAQILPQLLDKNSPLNEQLKKGMEKHYVADGNNAKRVANIVNEYLK